MASWGFSVVVDPNFEEKKVLLVRIFEFEKIQYFEIFVLRFYQCTRPAKANEVFGYPELPGYRITPYSGPPQIVAPRGHY